MQGAIVAEGLTKKYGDVKALDGVDFVVEEGTVVGLLGPNGAGKTTTVRVLTTLLRADSGRAWVGGIDVAAHPEQVRRTIGLSGQYAAVDQNLTGRENLQMFGWLYHLGRAAAARRADELLERFNLTDAGRRTVKTYSGGMRRRLDLAASLVAKPRILFLDEPTTGLDPRSRLDLWDVIRDLVSGGTTLLLTTQYLEEADALADSIVVVDHGRVIARGSADELKTSVGGERIEVVVRDSGQLATASAALSKLFAVSSSVSEADRRVIVPAADGAQSLVAAVRELDAAGISLSDIALRRPTLDDVFLTLTGKAADDGDASAASTSATPAPAGSPS